MKKILYVLILASLIGCSVDDSGSLERPHSVHLQEISGITQRGFSIATRNWRVWVENILPTEEWLDDTALVMSMSASVDTVAWTYSVTDSFGMFSIAQIHGFADDYIDVEENRIVYDMDLSAVVKVEENLSVNVNYLTTMASNLILHNLEKGMSFEEARRKAHRVVLENLRLPTDLTDFEHYSVYGESDGDAMLAAVSVLVEEYQLRYSMSTAWITLEIDTLTEKFRTSEVYSGESVYPRFATLAQGILLGDGGASVRKKIEAKSPNGKVGRFEKYLSIFFAGTEGYPRCSASNEGEIAEFDEGYEFYSLICSDSVWRTPTRDDFDIKDQFNPNVEYGILEDPRDGRIYKTVKMVNDVWMAENLKYADSVSTPNLKGQNWCYNDDEENCETFGRLYSWTATMDVPTVCLDSIFDECYGKGICPEGWHVPTSEDIYHLHYAGESSFLSSYMTKSKDEAGFSILLGGVAFPEYEYGDDGRDVYTGKMNYEEMGRRAYMWTDNLESYGSARIEYFTLSSKYEGSHQLGNSQQGRRVGAYVRCVKDQEE